MPRKKDWVGGELDSSEQKMRGTRGKLFVTDVSSKVTDASSKVTDVSSKDTDASSMMTNVSSMMTKTSSIMTNASSMMTNWSSKEIQAFMMPVGRKVLLGLGGGCSIS